MTRNAESGTGAVWAIPNDTRVTPIGKFLRWSHLDELPQLLNVVRGEMALIGPRPERPEFVERIEQIVPNYQYRHRVLPGITGLAQVSLPADADLDSVRRKTTLDHEYLNEASVTSDIHILFCTLMLGFGLQKKMNLCRLQSIM